MCNGIKGTIKMKNPWLNDIRVMVISQGLGTKDGYYVEELLVQVLKNFGQFSQGDSFYIPRKDFVADSC